MNNKQFMMSNQGIGDKFLRPFGLLLSGMLLSFSALATDLEKVDYTALPGGKAQILLTFSEPVSKPHSFATDQPARIVLDFTDVSSKLAQKTKAVNLGLTRSITTIEAGNRTRTVVNLVKKVPYSIDVVANTVKLTMDAGGKIVGTNDVAAADLKTTIDNIDFRRGEDGEGRLKVDFDNPAATVNVNQQGDKVIVDLPGAALPDKLHRRLDVVDFATPITTIDSEKTANGTRLTIATKGKFEQLSYQSDNSLVVEVKPVTEEPKQAQKDQFGYKGEKLSLNFQNIEVRSVLQLLADFTGMNLVTSDTVKGNLTLRLKNVPWDQALDIILKTKGLAMRQNGNVMLVAPAAEIAAREKQELEAKKQLVELEPLYSEIIEVNFAKADDIEKILNTSTNNTAGTNNAGFLSPRGSVTVDQRTNSLLVRDTSDQLEQIRQLVKDLDIPVRQVLIESRIVIANNDFTKELGVRFGASSANNTSGSVLNSGATSGTLGDISSSGSQLGTSGTLGAAATTSSVLTNQGLNVNMPAANPSGSIALALAKLPLGTILQLELSAMQEEGKGEIVSSPRVITSNQKTATIEQGTEIPYQQASSSGATNVSFKNATLKLEVTPQITPDDRIVMDLVVNKDEVGTQYLGVPSIDTRSVETQVLVDNGETVVLGGIYEQKNTSKIRRVPFFGDLPYVGFLFRNKQKEDTQRELLVFVTPKIVKEGLEY